MTIHFNLESVRNLKPTDWIHYKDDKKTNGKWVTQVKNIKNLTEEKHPFVKKVTNPKGFVSGKKYLLLPTS